MAVDESVWNADEAEVSVSDEPTSSKKIKVVDRRWFDESGELRKQPPPAPKREAGEAVEETAAPSSPGVGPKTASGPEQTRAQERSSGPEGGAEGRVRRPSGAEFSLIVDLLAQQAVVLLTGAQGIEKNRQQARLFIDLLDILQEKTEGRLSPEEVTHLRDVLAQLQLAFVESGT